MFAFLVPALAKVGIFAGKKIVQAVGGHHGIYGGAIQAFAGAPTAISAIISGLGFRFFLGVIVTLYFTNNEFAHGVDICLGVLKSIVVHRLGRIF